MVKSLPSPAQLSAEELLPLVVHLGGFYRYMLRQGVTPATFCSWCEYHRRCFLVAFIRNRYDSDPDKGKFTPFWYELFSF